MLLVALPEQMTRPDIRLRPPGHSHACPHRLTLGPTAPPWLSDKALAVTPCRLPNEVDKIAVAGRAAGGPNGHDGHGHGRRRHRRRLGRRRVHGRSIRCHGLGRRRAHKLQQPGKGIVGPTTDEVPRQHDETVLNTTACEATCMKGRKVILSNLQLPLGLSGFETQALKLCLGRGQALIAVANASAEAVDPRLRFPHLDAQRRKPRLPGPTLANESLCRRNDLSTAAARSHNRFAPSHPDPTPDADWATPTTAFRATRHLKHSKLSRKVFGNPHGHAQKRRCFLKAVLTLASFPTESLPPLAFPPPALPPMILSTGVARTPRP